MFGVNDNHNDNNNAAQPPNDNQPQPASDSPANPISSPHDPAPVMPSGSNSGAHQDQPAPSPANDDLLKLKQDALKDLEPMVDKLDQTPAEKFKTLMMLIQASDNSSLVKEAYQAAKSITEEKERAQALIDVINEINYFTQR